MRRDKGFSLAETMIAAGLSGIVLLAAMALFKVVNRDTDLSVNLLESSINNLEAESIIKKDLVLAKHSLNRLLVVDDNKKYFFEYLVEQSCLESCDRTLTLEVPKGEGELSKPFYLLTSQPFNSRPMFYFPGNAFEDNGRLEYVSLDKGGILSKDSLSPWRQGQLLLLYSSSLVTDLGGDLSFSALYPSFLGWVTSTHIESQLKAETLRGLYRSETLFNGKREVSTDEESFLRKLPYTAGLANYLMIENIRIVRYQLVAEKSKGKLVGRLQRAVLQANGSWQDRAIAFNLSSVTFSRSSIDSPAISLEMKRSKINAL